MSRQGKQKLTAIYVLADPRDNKIRYIGKSIDPKRRYRSYTCYTRTRHTPIIRWCNKLNRAGIKPKMHIICWVKDWEVVERKYIKMARLKRNMLNIENGGFSNKVTEKQMTKGYITYRKHMASMVRTANYLEKIGWHKNSLRILDKIEKIRARVEIIRSQGVSQLEAFYGRVELRLGND